MLQSISDEGILHQRLCTWKSQEMCIDCNISGQLMCRYDRGDLFKFLLAFLPFGASVVVGFIRGGYGIYLLGWLVYWGLFFFIWEARVLCRHCPYWAEERKVLHCHANYGVLKIWAYDPSPLSKGEKVQLIVGMLIFVGYPFVFLLMGKQYLLTLVALGAVLLSGYNLRKNACPRCINFSCPLNTVPKPIVDSYLRHNAIMREAWEARGYQLGPYGDFA
ncbi:MAG: hypothetical protein GTO14_15725 [Anaerolineales bacterium]|nr:hypothetical protein [Anaerolineales bacterium]